MRSVLLAAAAALCVAVAGCATEVVVPAATPAGTAPAPAPTGADDAGFRFPEVPPIVVPDVTALTGASATVATAMADLVTPVSGISVSDARCDPAGQVVNRPGLTQVLDGRGGGSFVTGSSSVVNDGRGSGTYVDGTRSITVDADGSGTFVDGTRTITIDTDGSGTYVDATQTVTVNADGSGSYVDPTTSVTVNQDGSGTFTDATRSITVGPGSGTYTDSTVTVVNRGDGTGLVNGEEQAMPPVPPMPLLGRFPPVDALAPVGTACGTLIRIDDRVLFDFDRSDLRPDAATVLDAVGSALADVHGAMRIDGHTDATGADDYNLALSRRRAEAVRAALTDRGVGGPMEATGFGEAQPIAPNELDGEDNPAGRQLNRRVEIVVAG